ncbi:GNAT family acetyltransferase [Actinotalea ferrariae CF5-4]|uniref:GNAT family acetyltransferase n=1 Tax=Actinotalea ferrariae CF5-4 TaxID=948458 RepID=A0A021VUA3_9CELL|nr:GNAT family N-acetyltransferase [Actinotalea ferrariae]EYR62652.1 GNAT family acetyltransferase [Actinotalea ferrariae CF5-4]
MTQRSSAPAGPAPWRVLPAPVPPSPDHRDAWALHGSAAVSREADLDTYGHDDLALTAQYLWAKLQEQDYARRVRLVAVPADVPDPGPDDVVGSASVVLPRRSNHHVAHVAVAVRPAVRDGGSGSALVEAAEAIATAGGRSTVILESEHGGEPAEGTPGAMEPASGAGRIAADDPGAALCLKHGYALEQAARYSVLTLPVPPDRLAGLRAAATERAGADYRLVTWQDRAPQRWVDDWARLETRMSTDEPQAGLDLEEDPWDADRLRRYEQDIAASGHTYLLVAAEHVPTGTLAGFTMVQLQVDRPAPVFQEDTIVVGEHRGHRLGLLMKAGLLERLRELRPEARRVHTWNAEENAFMLGINVALGFRPAGVAGVWQKRLA